MSKTALERAALLRQAASDGRRNPDDLFGARMAIHDAFEGSSVDANRVCELLLSANPPLTAGDCDRLEMVSAAMERAPEARAGKLYGLCVIVQALCPW
ncbi:hypothetical protein CMV24_27910 [Pseudomonas plecoglossicida]|uniref:Uncharacterized protein n=2 Tax=Pseudomonas putida group TaxID=136845 RepID=A0A2A3LWP0_PSEDL|nr:hypothetical protein HB13667_07600 [Pseudomonas putida]PBJ92300.1 hypothetical protein CMV24_27910 [Pseudomonas plecoglossicida]POF97048.1 hypothetical protein BGP81_10050 [Pseudomonas putida]